MAFQLLAFFILTFRPPSREARIDLYLPTAPATLPDGPPRTSARAPGPTIPDLENDLQVRAEADAEGNLASLRLGETPVADPARTGGPASANTLDS